MHRRAGAAGLAGVAGVALALAIAAGCGGGGGSGTPGPATITVVNGGPIASGETLAIVVNDSAGRLVSSTAVTGSGSRAVTVPHDGSVIYAVAVNSTTVGWSEVIQPPAGTTVVFSDPLRLAVPTPTPAGIQVWNVSWNPVAGSASTRVIASCDSATVVGTTATLSNASCTERATAKVLVVARDSSQRVLAWHLTDTIPALPNVTTNVSFTLDQTAKAPVFAAITGVDQSTLVQGGVNVFDEDDDLGQPVIYNASSGPQGVGAIFGLYGESPRIGAVRALQYVFFSGNQGAVRVVHTPEVPSSLAMDMAGVELPTVPGYDAPSGALFFAMPLGFGDGGVLFSELSDGKSRVFFQALVPPGSQSVVLPSLPAEFLPPDPLAGFGGFNSLAVADLAAMNGYADFVDGFQLMFPNYFLSDGFFLLAGLD